MEREHRSSSHVQRQAEAVLIEKVGKLLGVQLQNNAKIALTDNGASYIRPDFYSEEHHIVGEIFAHIGKPKKAQDNKIANDILKMLLLEKVKGREYAKIIVVCDLAEKKKLEGQSALAESIRRFGIRIMYIEIDQALREKILQAQDLQKMTNVE